MVWVKSSFLLVASLVPLALCAADVDLQHVSQPVGVRVSAFVILRVVIPAPLAVEKAQQKLGAVAFKAKTSTHSSMNACQTFR